MSGPSVDTSAERVANVIRCAPFADNKAGIPEMQELLLALLAERDRLAAKVEGLRRDAALLRDVRESAWVAASGDWMIPAGLFLRIEEAATKDPT